MVTGVPTEYARAVWEAGGLPLLLPMLPPDAAPDVLTRLDGLLFTGGGDVGSDLYGRPPHPETYGVDDARDVFERALVEAILESKKPLLAVCRGIQILNVALGGSLVQHLPDQGTDHWGGRFEPLHEVSLAPDSQLAGIYGKPVLRVNSIHHQALERIGAGLRPVGHAPDGVTEAIELVEPDRWVIGIQWHPERPWSLHRDHQALFQRLIREAREPRKDREQANEGGALWMTGF